MTACGTVFAALMQQMTLVWRNMLTIHHQSMPTAKQKQCLWITDRMLFYLQPRQLKLERNYAMIMGVVQT